MMNYEYLDSMNKLQLAAKGFDHAIKYKSSAKKEWILYEPSRFIYAYFAFNSFYSINWEESKRQMKIVEWEVGNNQLTDSQDSNESISESKKIRSMQKYIYNSFIQDKDNQKDGQDPKQIIAKRFPKKISLILKKNLNKNIEVLDYIEVDSRISRCHKSRFIRDLEQLCRGDLEGSKFNKAWYNVLYFIYLVRNNIFHGSKGMIHYDERQIERLAIYTAILLATNDMLWEVIKKEFRD